MSKFIDIMADCFFTEYEENIAYDKAEKAIEEHDKQIRNEVIDECISKIDDVYGYYHEVPMVLRLLEELKE